MGEVVMPQMGESIVEGTITKWLKGPGDRVERDEALFEISTDKVDSEVPAPDSGVLEAVFFPEGETVEINTVVAFIGDGSKVGGHPGPAQGAVADIPPPPAAAPEAPAPIVAAPEPVPCARLGGGPRRAGPTHSGVRPWSGGSPRRRASPWSRWAPAAEPAGGSRRRTSWPMSERQERGAAAPPLTAFPPAPESRFGDFTAEPLSAMRLSIAEHMVRTKRVSPHVSTVHPVDCTRIARLRSASKDRFLEQKRHQAHLHAVFSCGPPRLPSRAYPMVNASLDGKHLIKHKEVNIGIAVALDWGLIVPVIRSADEKNVLGLQRAVNDLAARARAKALKADEISQGTFSVSNYGSYNALLATPAINQPQVAILGIGSVTKTPVVIDDAIAIRSISYLTLSFDHRAIDGAVADSFLEHMRGTLESWTAPVALAQGKSAALPRLRAER